MLLGSTAFFFSGLDSDDWAKSTRKMLEGSKYDYVYVFLEDHFLLKPIDRFKEVIRDMIDSKIEYFVYSFFDIGLSMRNAEGLNPDYSKHFYSFRLSKERLGYLKKANRNFYPYSLASICSKKYFKQLLKVEGKFLIKVPFFFQVVMENAFFMYPRNRRFWSHLNRLLAPLQVRFVIYPPASPFNLERSLFDIEKELLPFRVGGLKEELFANWDDDNHLSNSSLIKRGLYPEHLRVENQSVSRPADCKEHILAKGQSSRYQFCPDVSRVQNLPTKYIRIEKGSLEISSDKESFLLVEGNSVWIAANIPHTLLAHENCTFQMYIDSGL